MLVRVKVPTPPIPPGTNPLPAFIITFPPLVPVPPKIPPLTVTVLVAVEASLLRRSMPELTIVEPVPENTLLKVCAALLA